VKKGQEKKQKNNNNYPIKKYSALILILILGCLILYGSLQYLTAIVGALILFTLFAPLYNRLTKRLSKSLSASLILLLTIIIILIPFVIIGSLIVQEAIQLSTQTDEITAFIQEQVGSIPKPLPDDMQRQVTQTRNSALNFLQSSIESIIANGTNAILQIFLMYFLLYFMLTNQEKWKKGVYELLPFCHKNTEKFAQSFTQITNATIWGSGIIAIIQGLLITISFYLVGLDGALLWGFVSVILAFVPVIGTPLVWIPATIVLFVNEAYVGATVFLLFHAIVTMNIDNILRPILNKKMGNIHPVTSVLGIFIGLYLFGLVGLILGPLLFSFFVLMIKMYREEYNS